jgi:hypothetical protein
MSGKYMFTDPGVLDELIRGWRDQGDFIRKDGQQLQTDGSIDSPADDPVTIDYFAALATAFQGLVGHNDEMSAYTADYVAKLQASLVTMTGAEDASLANLAQAQDIQ